MNKMRAVAAELVNNYADNPEADVAQYLTKCGYTNLPSAMRNLKQWAKANEPGWLPDLQKISLRKTPAPKPAQKAHTEEMSQDEDEVEWMKNERRQIENLELEKL